MNLLKFKLSSLFSLITFFAFGQQKTIENNTIELLWERGVACFLNEDDRGAIENFEKLLLIINKNSIKFYPSNFYIAHSFRIILKTEGLTDEEADRMFNCYNNCLEEPINVYNRETINNIKNFIERKTRPAKSQTKWVDKTD